MINKEDFIEHLNKTSEANQETDKTSSLDISCEDYEDVMDDILGDIFSYDN